MRNHKGNEREYIQNCLKECRAEIRGSDMGMLPLSTHHACVGARGVRITDGLSQISRRRRS